MAKSLRKLREAVRYWHQKLGVFRENRLAAIQQYVGNHYGEGGTPDKVPLPLLAMAIRIYMRHLAPHRPHVDVWTPYEDLRAQAWLFEQAVNHTLDEINFKRTLQYTVLNAMFGSGMVKIGLDAERLPVEVGGVYYNVGYPYVETVDLDDAVWDVGSWDPEKWAFVGNRYRLPLDYVKEAPYLKNTDTLTATTRQTAPGHGDDEVGDLSFGDDAEDADELDEQIELWDIYCPRWDGGLIVTLAVDGEGPPLGVQEFDGPERGPYRMLGFGEVPKQSSPLPPVALWRDIHEAANAIYKKLIRQGERQKEITGYRSEAAADAEALKDHNDGDLVRMDNPEGIIAYRSGGIDQANMAFLIDAAQRFSWVCGNLDALGGLSSQAETLGQEQLLAASSSKSVEDLQTRVIDFTGEVCNDHAFYIWNDWFMPLQFRQELAGGVRLMRIFDPSRREGDFLDFNIRVNPSSAQYVSSIAKAQFVEQFVTQEVLPALPFLQQMGVSFDFAAYTRLQAKYRNIPELEDIIVAMKPSMRQQMGQIGPQTFPEARQAPVTRRETVRTSRNMGSRQGNDQAMMALLMGGSVQRGQMSGMRPGGI